VCGLLEGAATAMRTFTWQKRKQSAS